MGLAVVRIELLHALLAAALYAALSPAGLVEPRALFLGALFMGANFVLLSCGIRWGLTPFAGKGRIRAGIALLVFKTALFLGLFSSLLIGVGVEPLSFTLGFSCLLAAIVVDRLWASRPSGA